MIGSKIADKITSFSKKCTKKLENNETEEEEDVERAAHKKRYISPEESGQIIDDLRLVPTKDIFFLEIIDEFNVNVKKDIYPQKKGNKLLMN